MASVEIDLDEETKHKVMATLGQVRDDICQEITDELDALLEKAAQIARDFCPKDTGALASSISTTGGAISSGLDFYNGSIYAGDESIVNPKTGIPTSEYALFVHDGHALPNGMFYEGVPFLDIGMQAIEAELEEAVSRALKELCETEPSGSDVARMAD